MLNKIFDDKKQPLYMLCNKIILNRIENSYLIKHIQHAAVKKWHARLPDSIMSAILNLTESHPYYVNFLCDKLWELDKIPTHKNVEYYWDESLFQNRGKIVADLELLNTNRMKVLTMIALLGAVSEPNSKVFLDKVKLPLSSTQSTVQYLLNHDYIYENKTGLKLIDPLMKKFIVESYL
jgi:uncharacterized protein